MLPRLFVAAAFLLGGCTQLIGADDPVAGFEVDPAIAGDYLLGLDASATGGLGRYELFAEIDHVDPDARTFDLVLQALAPGSHELVGDEYAFEGLSLGNNETFTFSVDQLDITIDAAATGDTAVVLDAFFAAEFPILDGVSATSSGFCGEITGAATTPETALSGVSFAAVKAEFPTGTASNFACADLAP